MNDHRLEERAFELARELNEADQLIARCSQLLTETANELKGPPPELHMHDWSDLPARARELKQRLDARERFQRAALELLSHYGWVPFGTNVDSGKPLVFSEQLDENGGIPFFERVVYE